MLPFRRVFSKGLGPKRYVRVILSQIVNFYNGLIALQMFRNTLLNYKEMDF